MHKITLALALLWLFHGASFAQETFPVNGVQDERPGIYAFTNATLFVDYQTKIDNATLLINDGIISEAGQEVAIPAGAVMIDLQGKHIYPSLIDIYSSYGLSEIEKKSDTPPGPPQMKSNTKGAFSWNEALKPEYNAIEEFSINTTEAEMLRKAGFGAVASFKADGVARGSANLVSLGDENDNEVVLTDIVAAHYSFDKGTSKQEYPSSLMGSIALLRQAYLDAAWYKSQDSKKIAYNRSLESWNNLQQFPQIFEVKDKLSLLRADQLGDEFDIQYIIKGAGDEYQRIEAIKATKAPLIVPVDFPDAYDVTDPYDAMNVSLEDMKHWELAPANLAILARNGINFAITMDGLDDRTKLMKNIQKAIEYGLDEQTALKAFTYTPAQLLHAENKIGSLRKGMLANFIITSDSLFKEDAVIYQNWVQGKKYEINNMIISDLAGNYELKVGNESFSMQISGKPEKPEVKIVTDTVKIKASSTFTETLVSLSFNPDTTSEKTMGGAIRLSGWIEGKTMQGRGQLANGNWVPWSAAFTGVLADSVEEKEKEEKKTAEEEIPGIAQVTYPFTAYGFEEKPVQETLLIKGATVWTNEEEGIIENADVLVENGKITRIGKNLSSNNATVIDGSGKHLTSGIIDEHSHIAISKGVNEGSQAVTAEVRIGDVVNSEDINIYRQLAGGVTASQLLHGSANPIGGQSALIKLRWGASPEEMKIENASPFIKFALGENVKQSNWGQFYTVRFPQTRMGVEQVIYDAFTRAKVYNEVMEQYNSLSSKAKANAVAPRKDLELETLVEILNKERFITCHSYVQSEINMLMHAADDLGFDINTFTHILEGYKVADKMAERNIGGSTFADWWAYKFEVREAIPYNAAIMHKQGVVTAINSDDAEMGRRLNQEAAKIVKYGGVSEEEAWKMVTLNPAKLLHLEDRMGSIKKGKDADLVLWSTHPLSVYAKAEKTIIDGIVYYDIERDNALRKKINVERARLVQKMLNAKEEGSATQEASPVTQHIWHCDDRFDVFEKL